MRVLDGCESALDYDLMTRTGRTLREYLDMGAAGMVALCHFVRHLPADSVTISTVSGYEYLPQWASTLKTNAMLADIYDGISALRYTITASRSKKKPKKPKPYPRPWVEDKGTRKIGKDPIPVKDFWSWWDIKVKEAENAGR